VSDDDQPPVMPDIPVTFRAGGQELKAKTLIKTPTEGEVNLFSDTRIKTCGGCRFFDRNERTMQKFRQTDLYRKLRFDWKWREKYLPGGQFDQLGICGQEPDKATGAVSRACDHYKAK
jgi:hypothetical protein